MRDILPDVTTDAWALLARLLADDGSPVQPGFARLSTPRLPMRDIADALHCLCLLHGHRPGAIDLAAERAAPGAFPDELAAAAAAFATERHWLARLISVAGPLPSTPNQTASENAIAVQRHALEMLARSDRQGCAPGSAFALILDWRAMRPALERFSDRLGVAPPDCALPTHHDVQAFAAATPPAGIRGLRFGAEQLLAQHRGLWALVESRAVARR